MKESNQCSFRPVRAVSPAAAYVGGKRLLSKRIVEIIETIPHNTYAEPFVGMGGVFLRRSQAARSEVVNDYSRDVAGFFRILQRHYPAFMDELKFRLSSRAEFDRLNKMEPETLTDLERAARFIYLQRLAYGGKVGGRNFGVNNAGPARFNISRLAPVLEELHERLSGVVIECLPWQQFIQRYDTPETLFYLDPPYYGSEGYYGKELFSRSQFQEIADTLESIKGKFVLSLNDHPEVRRIFGRFRIDPVDTRYSVGGGHTSKDVGELIISKY